jgi:hypothetical protein
MRKALLLSLLALLAEPVAAADSGHCDAVPFTLGKPAKAAPKADKQANVEPGAAMKKAPPKVQPKPRPTLLATCKSSKKS